MFNMGFVELVVLSVIAIIVIGPKQLPEVARAIARLINEFKRATGELKSSIVHVENQAKDCVLIDDKHDKTHSPDQESPSADSKDPK